MNDRQLDQPQQSSRGSKDETTITEVELAPDGRIYLFGASEQFLLLLRDCGLGDEMMLNRLPIVADVSPSPNSDETNGGSDE